MEIREGYKRTEVGVIPVEWESAQLEAVTSKIGSGITPTGGSRIYKRIGIPFVRSQNVQCGKMKLMDIAYIDEITHKTFEGTEIQYDDVLLNITGASIGRSSVADDAIVGGNVNQHVCILRPIKNILNSLYLCGYILSAKGQKYIDDFQSGGNREGLNFKQIASIKIPIPPLPEQQAIATVLSDIDGLISSLTKLIEKKKNIKQGIMQELLTGKKRLDGFIVEWTVENVGKLGKAYGGLTGKTKGNFGQGNSRYIPFMNVMSNPIIDLTFLEYVNIENGEFQHNVRCGDLFFNTSSETPEEVGMCSTLISDIKNVYLNSFCFGFRLNNLEEINPLFLSYLFRSNIGRNLMFSLAQGATRYNLSKTNFYKLEIKIPEYKEQTAIVTFLSDMDSEIEVLKQKSKKYKDIKQGMMQELLTGRIRLIEGVM